MKTWMLLVLALLPVGTRARGVELSVQPEIGISAQHKQLDDIYVEYYLPGPHNDYREELTTPVVGLALRLDSRCLEAQLGWRNLGDTHINNAGIIADAAYFAERTGRAAWSAPSARWDSVGNVQQLFVEVGYKVRLGSWALVPAVGIAEDRIQWHTTITFPYAYYHGHAPELLQSKTEQHPAPFGGLTLQRGSWGAGIYYLVIHPVLNTALDPAFPGQGPSALYLRVTRWFTVL